MESILSEREHFIKVVAIDYDGTDPHPSIETEFQPYF